MEVSLDALATVVHMLRLKQDGNGDLKIRPCTPPAHVRPELSSYASRHRALSAVQEQDEHDSGEEVCPQATLVSLEHGPQGASYFVFRDDRGHQREMLLSEHQERVLCEHFNAAQAAAIRANRVNSVYCIFLSTPPSRTHLTVSGMHWRSCHRG
jgi:hypothetical protein